MLASQTRCALCRRSQLASGVAGRAKFTHRGGLVVWRRGFAESSRDAVDALRRRPCLSRRVRALDTHVAAALPAGILNGAVVALNAGTFEGARVQGGKGARGQGGRGFKGCVVSQVWFQQDKKRINGDARQLEVVWQ